MKKPYLLIITVILCLVLTGGKSLAKDTDAEKIEALKQAIRIDPDDVAVHYNLGSVAQSHYSFGVVYVFVNDRGSALEQYNMLISLDAELANKLINRIYK
jgi:hypothetical protein